MEKKSWRRESFVGCRLNCSIYSSPRSYPLVKRNHLFLLRYTWLENEALSAERQKDQINTACLTIIEDKIGF
jgi:hypothetical protein